jgi:hypothetical protein
MTKYMASLLALPQGVSPVRSSFNADVGSGRQYAVLDRWTHQRASASPLSASHKSSRFISRSSRSRSRLHGSGKIASRNGNFLEREWRAARRTPFGSDPIPPKQVIWRQLIRTRFSVAVGRLGTGAVLRSHSPPCHQPSTEGGPSVSAPPEMKACTRSGSGGRRWFHSLRDAHVSQHR